MSDCSAAPDDACVRASVPRFDLKFLHGLRGLAALHVVAHHIWLDAEIVSGSRWLNFAYHLLFVYRYDVDLFIVLSGFCLMLPVIQDNGELRGGAWGFYRRRVGRLLPPYYFGCLFSLLFAVFLLRQPSGRAYDNCLPITLPRLTANLLMIQDYVRPWHLNYAYWSIAVECQICLLFPFILNCWRKIGAIPTTLLLSLISYAAFLPLANTVYASVRPHYIGLFCAGMLGVTFAFSQEEKWRRRREQISWRQWAFGLLILLVGIAALGAVHAEDFVYFDPLAGLLFMTALVGLTTTPKSRLRSLLETRFLTAAGAFSYSLYLIHVPLVECFWRFLLVPLQLSGGAALAVWLFAGLPLLLSASYIFHLFCERPFLRKKALVAPRRTRQMLPALPAGNRLDA